MISVLLILVGLTAACFTLYAVEDVGWMLTTLIAGVLIASAGVFRLLRRMLV